MFGWLAAAILFSALITSGYYRSRARRGSETIARRREGGFFMAIRAVVSFLLFFPVIGYLAFPLRMTWASFDPPVWIRWAGFILGLLTIPMIAWVSRSLGRNVSETVLTKREHQLVIAGPYQWVRHPLYTTGICLFVALGLIEASWFVLFMAGVAALLVLTMVIPAEERALVAKFGDQYRAYMARTGRLLPRFANLTHPE
jgi:protein-S-isoprenylcysteine O-methyltransferase Ste14